MNLTHKGVSLAKSAVRLAACFGGIYSFALFCIGFALAEVLGIVEEIADKRPETSVAPPSPPCPVWCSERPPRVARWHAFQPVPHVPEVCAECGERDPMGLHR